MWILVVVVEFMSNISDELDYVWTCVVLGVDRLGVVFESDYSSLGLPYNEEATHLRNL
jgi:hypothetical protein